MTLGGIVCIRNGDHLDYCWRESVRSLLPVCDMVTLCVGSGNQDGTEEVARAWSAEDSRIVVCIYPWPEPVGDSDFWVKWLQYARMHTPTEMVFQLDADEVLHEKAYEEINQYKTCTERFSLWCQRWNFWRDLHHIVPFGVCLGHRVIRMQPQNLFLPSDGAHPNGAEVTNMARESSIEIYHYGFLRRRDAFFRKAKDLQKFFFNTYDPRLQQADEAGGNWMEHPGVTGWEAHAPEVNLTHPQVMATWLQERGYD